MKIGICDYGIGGIGLYQLIRKKSDVDVVYISDAGYTPYGKVSEAELKSRVEKVIAYFHAQGIDHIAVACNAASTVIPRHKNITGIIEHAIEQVLKIQPQKIAITGGSRTIDSGLYKTAFELKGIVTLQQVAQELSVRIEAGDLYSQGMKNDIERIFRPLSSASHILLACTHYPVITQQIQSVVPGVVLLDPAEHMCYWILQHWGEMNGNGASAWLTTGNPEKMSKAAYCAFGLEAKDIKQIII